ncbi:uncharacterized protein LOC105703595 [Orussus abietinus]|uniref:uncharacterized protein LOC105703595 n=1 Tax=Orussus abietinus TaxID=222816 RepID=UPI000626BCD5|nr:uncharacterized protein LOC105703595 [Orussus abietinus]
MKCVVLLVLGMLGVQHCNADDGVTLFDRGYRTLFRVYEECQLRNSAVSPCLKKKAIAFFERLGRIEVLPISENMELVRVEAPGDAGVPKMADLEVLGRTGGASRDDLLNEVLFDRVASLLNGFNVQISLPKMTSGELKRSVEEGRGKMKKMMGMMMMGIAMKMAAMIPIAIGVLFLLAGKALIISKIALVLSLIIGLKKLLSQKQSGHDSHHGWQQSSGGWDRSFKKSLDSSLPGMATQDNQEYAQNLAYSARSAELRQQQQ